MNFIKSQQTHYESIVFRFLFHLMLVQIKYRK